MTGILVALALSPLFQEARKLAEPPSTASATMTLQDVDVGELLDKLKLKLGIRLAGKITIKASLSVDLGDATRAKAYTIRGRLKSDELLLNGLKVQKLTAEVVYVDGKLTLTELKGSTPTDGRGSPGDFRGTARAAIEPRGDLVADLTFANMPLGPILKVLPGGPPVAGSVGGVLAFRSPVDDLADPAKWIASADLGAPSLAVFGRTIRDARLKLTVKDGKATLADAVAIAEGVPFSAEATLALTGTMAFDAAVRTRPQELGDLAKLVPELPLPTDLRGKLTVDSTFSGTLNPLAIAASGSVAATDLGIGEKPAGKLSAKWSVTPDRVQVTDLSAELYRGTIVGSAEVPLVPTKKGEFQLDFKDVDAAAVGAAFPRVPVRLTGLVSGRAVGTIPVAKPKERRAIAADVSLAADKLTVQGIPSERLTGKLAVDGETLRYELEGKTLGGSFEVKGRYPEAKEPKEPKEEKGFLRLRSIDLARLMEALKLGNVPLRGRFDLTFDYSADGNDGSGRYAFRGLRWGRSRLISELGGRVLLRNGQFELTDTVGPVAGGTIRARVRAAVDDPGRNFFRFDLDRVDIGRLLGAFTSRPDLVEGNASLTLRGRFWPEFRATGSLGLSRGRLAGLTATDVRVPFTLTARREGGQLTVRDANGTIGNGRATAQLDYQWGAGSRLDGQIRFTNVQLGNVFTDLKQSNYFGSARTGGRIDLGGENIRDVDDLKATVTMNLARASVRELPVLQQIVPFVPPNAALKPFDTGELRGRLARGVFRIERLVLANPSADLYADGAVGLDGRLDLSVIVRTGSLGLNDVVLRQTGVQLASLATPLPLQVVRRASELLSNRTVRLVVAGTVDSPQPRVNAAAFVSEEALRYLLRLSVFGDTASPSSPLTRSNRPAR